MEKGYGCCIAPPAEALIHHVLVNELLLISELSEGVDDDTEEDVEQDDDHEDVEDAVV